MRKIFYKVCNPDGRGLVHLTTTPNNDRVGLEEYVRERAQDIAIQAGYDMRLFIADSLEELNSIPWDQGEIFTEESK